MQNEVLNFFKNKKIFITGHTGFKGAWLCKILKNVGAEVTGYALEVGKGKSLFRIIEIEKNIQSVIGDIRDYKKLETIFNEVKPEIVVHLAAQPLVKEGYRKPAYTYETNVMGTVNILECIRNSTCVKSFLNVTTDKVYLNREWEWGYRENEELVGYDPYSNSKSCSELVTYSYKNSFFSKKENMVSISTARAGNVIGGGDFAANRIIPDCVRAAIEGKDIIIRNPYSIRPYQHVLETIYVYLMILANQSKDMKYAGNYNVGPDAESYMHNMKVVDLFIKYWGNNLKKIIRYDEEFHESNFLKLDCSKLKSTFGWEPRWNLEKAIEKTVEWTKCWKLEKDINECMDRQIQEFLETKKLE